MSTCPALPKAELNVLPRLREAGSVGESRRRKSYPQRSPCPLLWAEGTRSTMGLVLGHRQPEDYGPGLVSAQGTQLSSLR